MESTSTSSRISRTIVVSNRGDRSRHRPGPHGPGRRSHLPIRGVAFLTRRVRAPPPSGEVTGEVVYANRGTKEDFERLTELGVDVTGRIVIARYGGNFRGYKAKFAEAAGAGAGEVQALQRCHANTAAGSRDPMGREDELPNPLGSAPAQCTISTFSIMPRSS